MHSFNLLLVATLFITTVVATPAHLVRRDDGDMAIPPPVSTIFNNPQPSDLAVPGFEASNLIAQIGTSITSKSSAERKAMVERVKGIFQVNIKNAQGQVQSWTIDLKNGEGDLKRGKPAQADTTIELADKDFCDMAAGRLKGQMAFLTGKIKVTGNYLLAMKFGAVLKSAKASVNL